MYSFIRSVSESEESEESELEGIECALQRGFVMADLAVFNQSNQQSKSKSIINQCLSSVILVHVLGTCTSGYLDGYWHSNRASNHFAKISAAYCARMRTALIKRFEAAERSDLCLRGAAANLSCTIKDLHVK